MAGRSRRTPERPALSRRLREQLTHRQRQEEQDLLRRYDDRPINDREPPPRWM
jgi:hypothetical protein